VSFQRPQHEKQIKGNNTPPHHIATHPVQSDPIRFDAIQFHFESESESVEQSRALLQLLIKPKSNQLLDVFVLANRREKNRKEKQNKNTKEVKNRRKIIYLPPRACICICISVSGNMYLSPADVAVALFAQASVLVSVSVGLGAGIAL